MAERIPPHGRGHPEEYRQDLHPDAGRDPNVPAAERPQAGEPARTVYDDKELHARLDDWSDADLKRIPLAPEGEVLRQGATYLDLGAAQPVTFTALASSHVKPHDRYVAKQDVDHELWNRLLQLGDPSATEAPERSG